MNRNRNATARSSSSFGLILVACGGQSSPADHNTPAAGASSAIHVGGNAAGGTRTESYSTARGGTGAVGIPSGGNPSGGAAAVGGTSLTSTAIATIGGYFSTTTTTPTGGRNAAGSANGGNAAAGKATGGNATGGKATGGNATIAQAGSTAGSTSTDPGGTAGSAQCPAIKCSDSCSNGTWIGLDGCSTCACAPPLALFSDDAFSCPTAALSLTATSSYFIGGIDRWDITFTWNCAAPVDDLGQPLRATLRIGITQTPPAPISSVNRTFFNPDLNSAVLPLYQVSTAIEYIAGSGRPEIDQQLVLNRSFLSIRREGDRLVGGLQFVGRVDATSHVVSLAGPFDVAVPKS